MNTTPNIGTRTVAFPLGVQAEIQRRLGQNHPRELPAELATQIEELWALRESMTGNGEALAAIDAMMADIAAPDTNLTVREENLDGRGYREHHVYGMGRRYQVQDTPPHVVRDYWTAVTDVRCPCCADGMIRWHEAGYVPGYRICDKCERHFQAAGSTESPELIDTGRREG